VQHGAGEPLGHGVDATTPPAWAAIAYVRGRLVRDLSEESPRRPA
jgi:hypothetical protein